MTPCIQNWSQRSKHGRCIRDSKNICLNLPRKNRKLHLIFHAFRTNSKIFGHALGGSIIENTTHSASHILRPISSTYPFIFENLRRNLTGFNITTYRTSLSFINAINSIFTF